MTGLIELEGQWLDPTAIIVITRMEETIGPRAEGQDRYFHVYLRGGGKLLFYADASRLRLLELVRKFEG